MGSKLKGGKDRKTHERPWPVLKLTVYALLTIAVLTLLYLYWFSPQGQEKTRQALDPNAPPLQTNPM